MGTAWTGTAGFATADGGTTTIPVEMLFLWESASYIYGWPEYNKGYSAHGWGTTGGTATKVYGYPSLSSAGVFIRDIHFGTPSTRAGHWDNARLSGDRQLLTIGAPDVSWEHGRGMTFELHRKAWPTDMPCPAFRTCGSW